MSCSRLTTCACKYTKIFSYFKILLKDFNFSSIRRVFIWSNEFFFLSLRSITLNLFMSHRKLQVSEMHRMSVDEFVGSEKLGLIIVLDNVRSQHNIGAVFRSADAFGLEGVLLCGICCTPPNQEIHKTALGAELSVAWQHFDDTRQAIAFLRERGYLIYSVEQTENSQTLDSFEVASDEKIAVVLGHEVFGVSQEVVDMSDGVIEIPQYGTKHSLNVSVAAGIVMYQISEKMRRYASNNEKICH